MNTPRLKWIVIGKILLAMVSLAALAGVAGASLAPNVPVGTVLLFSALGVALLCGPLLLVIIVEATLGQAILRNGGTDTQWLWFNAEPPGLAALRAQRPMQDSKPEGTP